eukprot:IDg23254t1
MSGGNHEGGVTNLFAPVQAPRIKSVTQKAVQDFLAEREAYENLVEAQSGLKPVTYRSCFQASYLKLLVRAEVFGEDIYDVSQLSDDTLKTKLQDLAGISKDILSSDAYLKLRKRFVSMHPNRVLHSESSYCPRLIWTYVKSTFVDKASKAAVKHIIAFLEPPSLKQNAEEALELEKVQPLYKYRQANKKSKNSENGLKKPDTTKNSGNNSQCGYSNNNASAKNSTTDSSKPKKSAPPCLVPGCADTETIHDSIVDYLGNQGVFIPTRRITDQVELLYIDGSPVSWTGEVQISQLLQTSAGPCRLRNVKAKILKSHDTFVRPALDFGMLIPDSHPGRVGKLGLQLSQLWKTDNPQTSTLSSLMNNGNFPLKDGDDFEYRGVDIGEQDQDEPKEAIDSMIY